MIGLGREELAAGFDPGDGRRREYPGSVQLCDVGFGDASLLRIRRENCRTVLRAGVRPLMVQLGRVVRDREIDLEQPAIIDRVHASNRSDSRARPITTRLGLEMGAYVSADEALKLPDLGLASFWWRG